jgi:FlaA1/EpsC-like NDP-sugar epimerase
MKNQKERRVPKQGTAEQPVAKDPRNPGMMRRPTLILIDVLCFVLAYVIDNVLLALAAQVAYVNLLSRWPNLLVLLGVVMLGRAITQVYYNVWRYPNVRAYTALVAGDACSGAVAFLITYALARMGVRSVYLNFWEVFFVIALFAMSTLLLRFAYQLWYQHRNMSEQASNTPGGMNKVGVAIVGAGQVGMHLAEELRSSHVSHYKPVCFIDRDPNKAGMRIADLRVYKEDDRIITTLKSLPVQEIFVAIPNLSPPENARLVRFYSEAGYKVKLYDFPIKSMSDNAAPAVNNQRVVREFRIEELLGRETLEDKINAEELKNYFNGKVVLVTGGGGSIGSELCRQLAECGPKRLIILDIYENNAYDIQQELRRKYGSGLDLCVEIASVRDPIRLDCIFNYYRPQIVFHAAAHKHVPLMEHSSCEAIKNNVMGTYNAANMAEKYGAERFVLISTDKAVNPTNVMGASKRMCEMVVQCRRDSKTEFTAVRFGNVLGSNGSVIPLFKEQIRRGGPVTITDKRIIRYFMTIPEASRLVMLAGSMAKDGELFVLDMGKQVHILDLAENMIRMMGYVPYKDIDIVEIGLRPGEKLYEELLMDRDHLTKTSNSLIFIETDTPLTREEVDEKLAILNRAVKDSEGELASPAIKAAMKQVVPTFHDPEEVNSKAAETREMKEANSEDKPSESIKEPAGVR